MATMDNDGIKINGTYWPFAIYEECDGCKFAQRLKEVDGEPVNRTICKMTPDVEDSFLFSDLPERKIPPCLRD